MVLRPLIVAFLCLSSTVWLSWVESASSLLHQNTMNSWKQLLLKLTTSHSRTTLVLEVLAMSLMTGGTSPEQGRRVRMRDRRRLGTDNQYMIVSWPQAVLATHSHSPEWSVVALLTVRTPPCYRMSSPLPDSGNTS